PYRRVLRHERADVPPQDRDDREPGRIVEADGCRLRRIRIAGRTRAECPDDLRDELAADRAGTAQHVADGMQYGDAAAGVLDLDLAELRRDVTLVEHRDEIVGQLGEHIA